MDYEEFNLSEMEFRQRLEKNSDAVLLDVRTADEYKEKRLPNSILLDFYASAFPAEILKLDREKEYLIYCRAGNRSFYTLKFMLDNGFKKVSHLAPGIIGWKGEIEF